MAAESLTIQLFSTQFCHLCEAAEEVTQSLGIHPLIIEIAEDNNLISTYGLRIPVLKRTDTGAELNWPFDAATVLNFVS